MAKRLEVSVDQVDRTQLTVAKEILAAERLVTKSGGRLNIKVAQGRIRAAQLAKQARDKKRGRRV